MSEIIKNAHLTRQADLIPIDKQGIGITIVGAGAIGSHAALALAKSGFTNLRVFDFDDVSIENMSSQGYRFKDIGKPKVVALADIIKDYTEATIETVNGVWEPRYDEHPIVVLAVDSMDARSKIFATIVAKLFNVTHVIDPRMGAEVAALYCFKPHSEAEVYGKTLYSDKDAVQEKCTAKATNYTANMLSGLVVKCIKNLALGERYPRIAHWNIKDDSFEAWHPEL